VQGTTSREKDDLERGARRTRGARRARPGPGRRVLLRERSGRQPL